jgi:CDP-diacylglycerol--glycerol-3-phosphate 3-phosphatidyltransferase
MDKKKKFLIVGIISSIIGIVASIVTFIFRRRKDLEQKQEKIFFYPQDIILKKTLLKFIPESITPNQISILRIILTPFAAFLIAYENNLWIVLGIFLFTSFTDMIDGAMARTRDQITTFGKIIDPIADKLLIIFCAVLLLPKFGYTWLLITIMGFELLNLMIAGISFKNKQEISANIFGKIKMFLQVLGIALLLIQNYRPNMNFAQTGELILVISLGFNFCSLLFYIFTRKTGI